MTMTEITRRYSKYRTHMMLSPEVLAAIDSLADESASAYVERAVWAQLLAENSTEEIQAAIDQLHDDEPSRYDALEEPKAVELPDPTLTV